MDQATLLLHAEEQLTPALVVIPAGWFLMGCDSGQDNEKPVHRIWIDEFLLAPCQVTNTEYARFVKGTGSAPPPFRTDAKLNQPNQPVVGVSWHEATRYCEWLTAHVGTAALGCPTGRSPATLPGEGRRASNAAAKNWFRLPTEAEWERAARGGREGELFPWGDTPPQSLPDYAARCAAHWKTGPEPVGRAAPNGYGLYNMCDNVHEWCSDWYSPDYYAVSPGRNPHGPETGERRASRGGSWRHHIKMSRCAARSSIPPEFQYADYGFRVACDIQLQVRG
jgi:formylglycine-generating enzyme required for sulfatase activity